MKVWVEDELSRALRAIGLRPISGGNDEPPADPPDDPPAPPAPQFLPVEQFQAFQQQMQGSMSMLTESMQALREIASQQQRPAPSAPQPAGAVITKEQFKQAVREGDADVVDAYLEQQGKKLVDEHVAPLRDTGLRTMASQAETLALMQRNEKGESLLPYYARFKKEIEGHVKALPESMRLQPEVYKIAHDAVVGAHMAELLAEAQEAAIRKSADVKPDGLPTAARGRIADPNRIPSPEDVFGEGYERALADQGVDLAGWLKKRGFSDWKTYYTTYKDHINV